MFKDVLQHANLAHWTEVGLVIFFVVFLLTSLWALTRSREQVRRWAEIPLERTRTETTDE